MDRTRRISPRQGFHKGVATTELAVCMPLLIACTFATIDICSAAFLKESLTIAAYEGARIGMLSGGTNADATNRIEALLEERGIQYGADAITISGDGFDEAETLDLITVTVRAPCDGNLISPAQMFLSGNISASVTMRKQFKNE